MAATKKSRKVSKKSAKKATGSQKLSAARGGAISAGGAGSSVLAKTVAALDRSRLNHDIIIRGIPIPDIITGTIRARSATELGTAFKSLFGVQGIEYKPIKLFPKGIPVIDIIEAQIEGRIRRR
jgi:hypothetical protein